MLDIAIGIERNIFIFLVANENVLSELFLRLLFVALLSKLLYTHISSCIYIWLNICIAITCISQCTLQDIQNNAKIHTVQYKNLEGENLGEFGKLKDSSKFSCPKFFFLKAEVFGV